MRCYAFRYYCDKDVDISTIAASEMAVRDLPLRSPMGWRFDHPERYDRDEAWGNLQTHGRIVQVEITEAPDPRGEL